MHSGTPPADMRCTNLPIVPIRVLPSTSCDATEPLKPFFGNVQFAPRPHLTSLPWLLLALAVGIVCLEPIRKLPGSRAAEMALLPLGRLDRRPG